jgi:hypothetical protein
MKEPDAARSQDKPGGAPESGNRPPAQVTLSTIGDVSVAAAEKVGRVTASGRLRVRWIILFFIVLYGATSWLGIHYMKAVPWVRIFIVPLLPVLVATLLLWWRQRANARSQDHRFRLKIWQDALEGLGHAAANGVNAIRANLVSFRAANPQVSSREHLEEIEGATRRIEEVIQQSLDPVAWKGPKGTNSVSRRQ